MVHHHPPQHGPRLADSCRWSGMGKLVGWRFLRRHCMSDHTPRDYFITFMPSQRTSWLSLPLAPLVFWPHLGPHCGYVTHRDATIHGPCAAPWSSAYGLTAPLAHALAASPPSSDALHAWPASSSCVVLFRRAPTSPVAHAPPHAPVLACTCSPLHHLLGFSSAKYCLFLWLYAAVVLSPSSQPSHRHHGPYATSILIGTTLGWDPPPALMPQSLAPALPASTSFTGLYVTCALCTPCGSRTAACPCPRVHTQLASPPPLALTPSCSVYSARR